jgi:hypothetical protein
VVDYVVEAGMLPKFEVYPICEDCKRETPQGPSLLVPQTNFLRDNFKTDYGESIMGARVLPYASGSLYELERTRYKYMMVDFLLLKQKWAKFEPEDWRAIMETFLAQVFINDVHKT